MAVADVKLEPQPLSLGYREMYQNQIVPSIKTALLQQYYLKVARKLTFVYPQFDHTIFVVEKPTCLKLWLFLNQ